MSGIAIWLVVALASAAGACARFTLDAAVTRRAGSRAPWGTAAVNLSGALLAGILTGVAPDADVVLVLGLGFLGSYTTFSTWMVETAILGRVRGPGPAAVNVAAQVLLGVGLVAGGWAVGASI